MAGVLDEGNWNLLLRRIRKGKCTAFLGAGACAGILPLGSEIARAWDQSFHFPLEEGSDLAKVGQYLAVIQDPTSPKELIAERIESCIIRGQIPDFSSPDEPHAVLADLPLTTYITTNYDDFMIRALENRMRNARRELCRWNKNILDQKSVFESGGGFVPTAQQPVVYHLHGYYQVPDSIVLTEDDYLDFIVNVSRDKEIIPAQIQAALTGNSLLFMGYRIADWDFRVLFRSLITYMEKSVAKAHVSVQLVPLGAEHPQERRERAQDYLDRYFDRLDIRVYWGTCREFAAELRRRWDVFSQPVPGGG